VKPIRLIVSLLVAALFVAPRVASAHAIGLSRGEYAFDGSRAAVTLTFARGDVLSLAPSMDADGDGTLTAGELERGRDSLMPGVVEKLSVEAGGAPCRGGLQGARLTEGDGLSVAATFDCGARGASSAFVGLGPLLLDLPSGHRHLAHMAGAGDVVLFRGASSCTVPSLTGARPTSQPPTSALRALSIFRMGVEHILTGYDHLLFLFGLVLVASTWRTLLPVVTAFTLAHSLTLGVAALGLWSPPSRIVEPLIALSIAYVGIENLFMKDPGRRWRITFPFGLIHGFGFASALRELDLPSREVPVALVSFNVGVEVGQLAVLALALPILVWVRRAWWARGVRVPSLGVALVGAVWFVARIV
jgi:hydrogenase/urease accessory protein HupE